MLGFAITTTNTAKTTVPWLPTNGLWYTKQLSDCDFVKVATYVMQHLHKMELDTSNPNSGVSLAFYFSKRSSTITMCWSGPNQISAIYLFTYCQSRTMLISNGSFPEQGCGCSMWTREVSFLLHLTFCPIGSILLICVDVLKTGSSLKR